MKHNTRVIVVSLLVMLAGFVGSGIFNASIAASQGRNELIFTDRAEDGAPLEVSLGVAMGAFRGIFVNVLWIRANAAKEEGRYYESIDLARSITKLQPRLPEVWTFHAWNLAYNISVTTHTPEERWQWVNAGVDLLRNEGLRTNPNSMHIHKELSWMLLHKVGGYTDDANQYYKRQFAYEWQNVLGRPPAVAPEDRGDRDAVIETFAQWIQPIVDAPPTMAQLREMSPGAARIADEFKGRIGEEIGYDFLRRYQLDLELEFAGRGWMFEHDAESVGAKTLAMHELRNEVGTEEEWTLLINHVRKRVLIDKYNMEPVRMVQLVYKHGPIDWRMPTGHSLYWAARGTDVGRMVVTPDNTQSFDFLNAYRMVMQSIQDLWRHGDLYVNYLDVHENKAAFYQAVPNEYFVESYGDLLYEVVEASGIYEDAKRPYSQYSAGYENFLRDAVRFFYRRGDRARADYWYTRLRTFDNQTLNDPSRIDEMMLPLDDFVDKQLYESLGSPDVAVSEVYGALQDGYLNGLLRGNLEVFRGQMNYARQVHAYFFSEQFREVAAAGAATRMEYMDRSFPFVAGMTLANIITQLPPEEAELLYGYAPEDLKRYAYDTIVGMHKERYDTLSEAGQSEPFDVVFPEPAGMEAHRQMIRTKLEQRQGELIEGVKES